MHPLVIVLSIFIVVGLVQRLFPSKRKSVCDAAHKRVGIGVVLVAPPLADVERKLQALLSLSTSPNLVKLYVAKMCEVGEVPSELSHLKTRVATRMHFVRARRNSPERLRATLIREVLEPYVLCLAWHHEVEWGWDDMLLRAWTACRDESAVLSTRLSKRTSEPGYLFVSSFDGVQVSFGVAPFAIPPPSPEPSIACSSQLLFASTPLTQRGWPTKKDLVDAHEDFALTAFLWMHGARFYAPHNQPAFSEVGHEETETPGAVRLPPATSTPRTREEMWTSLGVRRGKLSSRARTGLTLTASVNERFHKVGQTIALQREL